jgi:hydrogenase-1 operon protein HyaF
LSGLDAIAVKVEGLGIAAGDAHNAIPLLHEIRHALLRLAETDEPTTIDLSAIPFGPGDRDKLFAALGQGEVSASVNAMGETLINESRYPGVWIVRHHSPVGDELATHIQVTRLPSMLITPEADLGEAAIRLASDLETDSKENE